MSLWNKEIVINAPIHSIKSGFTSAITTNQNEETITIAAADEVREYFDRVFHTFAFPYYTQSELTSINPIASKLSDTWSYFLNSMQENIDRVYLAYTTEYAPLDNYDKSSTITTTFSGSEVDASSGSNTSSSTYGAQKQTLENEVAPDTNENFYNSTKGTTNVDSYTDSTSTTLGTSNTKSFNNRKDEVVEHTRGNIGTMSSQNMLGQELEIRKLRFIQWLCDEFAMRYFISMNDDERGGC